MDIHDVDVATLADGIAEVRATAGARTLRIRLPAARLAHRAIGDALLLTVLVPAMREGTTVRLPRDVPVSSTLADALPGIQRVYRHWNARLRTVELDARRYEPADDGRGTGLFYAGGVDSSWSLIAHEREVDTLIAVFGFDMTMSADEMAASRARNSAFAQRIGKEVVFVESDQRNFVREHGVSRTFVFGAMLSAVALLLGLRRCILASGHSAAWLRPDGSHPVLDWRNSNGTTRIEHDDVSVSRLAKTRAVAARPEILANLRVCWDHPNENCGRCPKCVRTMAALRLCGAVGPFPPLRDLTAVARMAGRTELDYVIEMAIEAQRTGDAQMLHALRKGLRRQDLVESLRHLSYALTGRKLHMPGRSSVEKDLVKYDVRPDLALDRFAAAGSAGASPASTAAGGESARASSTG
ncbi:MAG: hypothetical protein KJ018_11695 [Burkholderiales bacterium]|nr:hypothetical protein [Burkholderiales bacterium]